MRGILNKEGNGKYTLIQYDQEATSVYFQLKTVLNKKNIDTDKLMFFKPGKIVCLNKREGVLKIVHINSCRNPEMFENALKCISEDKNFDHIFGVKCDINGSFITIKK